MLKYNAYGELRTGVSTTDYQYTGQRSEVEVGLYFYVSRFYDAQLGRFISADTIVPEPNSIKGYDRFAYTNNNPINYNDPSGHRACDDDYSRGCNKVNPPGSGGGSGGGYNYGDGGSNDFDSPFNNTIIDDYIRGWQLVGTAWSIFNNPDAGWEAWGISGGYMLGWVGAHVALGVGVGGLVCVATGPGCVAAVEGVLGIGGGGRAAKNLIPGNSFVRIDPIQFDTSIKDLGLLTRYSNGKIWLTQYQYVNTISKSSQFETILYRQNLWPQTAGKFGNGATMRLVDINSATPAGVTNMINGIPQWYVTSNLPPETLTIIGRIYP
jgi:RHS repeat-associated protein